ncbi:MAG: hypothetical protein ACOYOT_13470 [Bacteroidales bacterium]
MEATKKKKLLKGAFLSILAMVVIFLIDYFIFNESEFAKDSLRGFVSSVILLYVFKRINGKNNKKQ